ncbi:MAG: RNA ligase partner protein [Candidatus Roizmanbacteria bacterium]|nr:RNA ligase partner protein [Candidatus Roizmanbacteria bacterium]
MNTYVIDTNLFFNMEAALGLGSTTKEILENFIEILPEAQKKQETIVVPPAIVQEIESFFDNQDDSLLKTFLGFVTVRSPAIHDTHLSGDLFDQLINDYRLRAFRGMKVTEEEIIKAAETFMGKEVLPQKEFQIAVGKIITNLRNRYKNATRTGTIDSRADFELIMLAKETQGTLVSTDEGVISWARKIGVKEMSSQVFGKKMQVYL